MAIESNYRKILLAMFEEEKDGGEEEEEEEKEGRGEEEEEEEEEELRQKEGKANSIDKKQLIKKIIQEVNDLFPLPPGTTLDSIVVKFYQLKKKIMNFDPDWKFMTSDIRYIADILPLLDAINIESEKHIPDVTRCVKICMSLYHETRIKKKENPLWNLDKERLVDFLFPNLNESQPEDKEKNDEN
jgi:hypothetical protein